MLQNNENDYYMGVLTLTVKDARLEEIKKGEFTLIDKKQENLTEAEIAAKSTIIDNNYQLFLQKQGIKIVPLYLYDDDETTYQQMKTLNGILLTGGGNKCFNGYIYQNNNATIYQQKVLSILKEAKRINKEERYFLIWGTCLGFESMINAENNNYSMLKEVDNRKKRRMANELIKGIPKTVLTGFFGDEVRDLEKSLFYFNHRWGILLDDFNSMSHLTDSIQAITSLKLENGLVLLTMAEYKEYPFFIVIFHPEKPNKLEDEEMDKERVRVNDLFGEFIKKQLVPASPCLPCQNS